MATPKSKRPALGKNPLSQGIFTKTTDTESAIAPSTKTPEKPTKEASQEKTKTEKEERRINILD